MANTIKALFLNVSRYSFTDESTGRVVEGGKLTVADLNPDTQTDFFGVRAVDMRITYQQYSDLSRQARDLVGKSVDIECTQFPTRKGYELRPVSITLSK